MADMFSPQDQTDTSSFGGPNFWQNLMSFGLGTMQAGSQPGATFLGSVGAGGLGAMQSARENTKLRSQLGLQQAQTNYYGAQTAKDVVPLFMQLQQTKMQRQMYGMPTDDIDAAMQQLQAALPKQGGGNSNGGTQQQGRTGGMTPSPLGNIGFSSSPSLGSSPPVPSQPQQGGAAAPQQGGGQGAQPGNFSYQSVLPVILGQRQPASKEEANYAAGVARQVGQPQRAEALEKYGMSIKEGFQFGPNGSQMPSTGGPADPRYIEQAATAEGWGKAGPEAWKAGVAPTTMRGLGSVYVNPYFGYTLQTPNEITKVNPTDFSESKTFVPVGIQSTGNAPQPMLQPQTPGAARRAPPQGAGPGGNFLVPQVGEAAGAAGPTPLAFKSAASPQPQNGVTASEGGAPAETSYMTKGPLGAEDIVKGLAHNYQDEGKKVYEAAQQVKSSIELMQSDLSRVGEQGFLAPGTGAETRLDIAKGLNSALTVMGEKPYFNVDKIAAGEDILKEAKVGGMKVSTQIFGGSKEAASVVKTGLDSYPQYANSYVGMQYLMSVYKEGANRETDLRNFETAQVLKSGGNLTGAQENFNQTRSPAMYARRAISTVKPYPVTSPQDALKRYLPGTHIVLPDGAPGVVPGEPDIPPPPTLGSQQ